MARKIVDIGVSGNDGTGDSIREAFRKTNENFQELYAVFGQGGFLKFTDLADTPDTLTGAGNKIPVVNSVGTNLVFKGFSSPSGTISITQDADTIKIDTLNSKLEDDPKPALAYSLNAQNQLIGGLRAPVSDSQFTSAVNDFNTQYSTSYTQDTFAINKGYADAKYVNVSGDTMTGPLNVPPNAVGTQVPRASEVVLKTGGDMQGILNLADHPGTLAGQGTPNGTDDLQAATKYYVDNSSYSSNYNLYVTTSGDDTQARTPLGKEGRDRSYAYASINRACQKAEELVNAAPFETGPYRQLIAYNDGAAFSEVTRIEAGVSGTTRVFFTNFGGNRVDQGKLPRPDIVSGKIVVGRTSGAKGFIYQYYGADGTSVIGEDYFDLQDVQGEFVAGENLEYDQAVKKIQISVIIESGIYEEDYPIRIPPNVAIVGDELRRVIVRPADRPSRSPWADVWFRRDKTFDGLTLTSTEYGYHYLTDPSDPLSEPKNNRDMDVFLCNDAIIIRQISCQGHGGFMMVLDPEGQILSKSAYIQQAGSFAGSVNKQRFAGGQFVDGFTGNIPLRIQEKLDNTNFLVTGSERAPTTPCSFVIDGETFKVDAYTDDGTGFGGSRQLIRRNIEFIKAEVIGYINTELSPQFQFNRTTCARDVGLIIDALSYDLALGTNFNSVRAGQAYYRGTQYDILPDQITQTNDALLYTKSLISELLSANSIARTRAEEGLDEILDIINNGVEESDEIVYGIPTGTATSAINSKDLLIANLEFIREETIAFISDEYPDFVYDEDKCRRDTEYIVKSVIYDMLYGGNSAAVEAGSQYYDGNGNLLIPGQTAQTTAAISYASAVAQAVVTNTEIEFPKQGEGEDVITQVIDLANPGSSVEAARIATLMANINTIINGGRTSAPAIVYPSLAGVDTSITDSRSLLLTNKESIKANTILYLDQRYSYNQTTCARDTGYIADAIAHDLYYGGNLKTIQAGLAYFNASASSKIVIDSQLANTLAAINYIKTVIKSVIENESPAVRYQQSVLQFVDTVYTDGALAQTRVDELFEELVEILDNPPTVARDARALLTANKEFIQAETIAYINATYVSFEYDEAKCERDVGYVIDALGYDLMFGSNFASIVAGRSYYRGNASVAVGRQQAATIEAYTYLKTLVTSIVNTNPTALASVTSNMDIIINIVTYGESEIPNTYIIPSPTGYALGFQNARNLIQANREFIKAEVIQYITNNYVGLSYDPDVCRRDIDYILDAIYYDLTYSGNLQTIIAAVAYYVGTTLQVGSSEKTATLAAYTYLKSLLQQLSIDTVVSALQSAVLQVRGDAGSLAASTFAQARIDEIIAVIDSGLSATPTEITPSTAWVSAGLTTANANLQSAKSTTASQVTTFINNNYGNDFVYNQDICRRDVGFIVSNVSSDLLYGGTYLTIRAALRYHVGSASSRIVLGEQLPETIDAINYAKYVAQQVLLQQAPLINYQNALGLVNPVTQILDNELDGSGSSTRLGQLMDLLVEVIQDPEVDVDTVLTGAKPINYPIYKLVISDTTPIVNPLEFLITGFVSKADSGVGDGSWDVVLSINSVTPSPLIKTRYRVYGNSNANYNNDAVECVASTSTSMTFRYPSDPGVYGSGTTNAEYVKDLMLLSAGNTSMCSNDFTQINDLGYGLVATNIGLIETVSVFSYYCWTAYYANNGGQIRSLNGSNAHGEYGIISAGSDPLEVPDVANLSDNMMQVARAYKQGIYSTDNNKDDLAIYFYQHDYAPYNVSEVEINHGSGVITELDNTSIIGGSLYTNGTYINVPLTGGTGSGALANIVVSGNVVTTVGLVTGGIRYTVGDILSVNNSSVGGTGSGFAISIDTVIGNGIARYEVASVTDVSNTIPSTITGTPTKTGPTGGKYYVTYSFSSLTYTPRINTVYTVIGAAVTGFNGVYNATASTATSVTLEYPTNPGNWTTGGSPTLWGRGNILRLNINTGGNNETSANGLATDLADNQPIIIRGNQNFKYYEVDDTNPVRPSTALTFVGDPNEDDAIVYRVLAYGNKGPLNEDLAVDESVLGFDTTYDYIKVLVDEDYTSVTDPENPGKTLGSTVGDVAIAVSRVNEPSVENRLNTGEMITAWDGKIFKVLSYEDLGLVAGYAIIRLEDVTDKSLSGTEPEGLNTTVDPLTNLDIAEPPTLRVGLAATEAAEIIVRISTCRVTGHDFLDIGTGSYNQTNYPTKIYGAPKEPNQAREVEERTRGRCFYVTTDQDGIFRVGRFFTVDQGTGRVTFAASIALSNLDGLGFKRGVTVSEFSNDDRFTDGANDALPTEAATQGYIDRRLGMDRTNVVLDASQLIGPGYLDREGILAFTGPDPLNMGGFRIANLQDPTTDSDAATRGYVDIQELSNLRVDTTTSPARSLNDLLVYNGVRWVNAETITTGDIQTSLTGKNLALNIKAGAILNIDVNAAAEIEQSKLNMELATTRASAPTGTDQVKQATTGLASFNYDEFKATAGWIQLQDTRNSVFTGTISSTTLNVTAFTGPAPIAIGQVISGAGITPGTRITAFVSGTGGTGSYTVSVSHSLSSITITGLASGVGLNSIKQIGNGTVLGNRSGVAAPPYEITPAQIVTDGDGIKNASFAPSSVGSNGRAMILTGITPNTYTTTNVTTTGQASSLLQIDGSGIVTVANELRMGGSSPYKILGLNGTTIELFTPGGAKFITGIGTSDALSTTTVVGTMNVNAITSASTTNFSPANATVTLSPTGTGTVTIAPNSVGTINNINIGGTTRGTAAFTTLSANNAVRFTQNDASTGTTSGTLQVTGGVGISGNIYAGGIQNTPIGATTRSSAAFTTLAANSTTTLTGAVNINGADVTTTISPTGTGTLTVNPATTGTINNVSIGATTASTGRFTTITSTIATGTAPFTVASTTVVTNLNADTVDGKSFGTFSAAGGILYATSTSAASGSAAGTAGQMLTSGGAGAPTWTTSTSSNTASAIVQRDGSGNFSAGVITGTATAARYADLAENYRADVSYEPGTVLVFGGDAEVTVTDKHNDSRVAGIVSTNPAHLMNAELQGQNVVALGLTGRLPCKVIGKVNKGDILVAAAKKGYAVVNNSPAPGTIVGKALENKEDFSEGTIEVVVGRF